MLWGSEIQTLLDMRDPETGFTPKALLDRPVLDDRLSFFYGVFCELNRDRRYSAAGSPFSLTLRSFIDYADFYAIPQEDRLWMWETLLIFDRVWVDEAVKRAKQESQKPVTTGKM